MTLGSRAGTSTHPYSPNTSLRVHTSSRGSPRLLRPLCRHSPSSRLNSNWRLAPTRDLSREKNSIVSVYLPFSVVFVAPPVLHHSLVPVLQVLRWAGLGGTVF